MARPLVRRAEGPADRMIDESGTRWWDFAHNVISRADDQRGNAAPFDHVSDETDGLMAERSVGDEQSEIDFRGGQFFGQRRRQHILDFMVPANASHEGEMKR